MRNKILLISVFMLISTLLFAQDPAPQRDPIIWNIGIRFLGADIGLGYRGLTQAPNPDTILWLIVGGGYEWITYFRDPSDHLYNGDAGFDAAKDPYYDRINGRFDVGIAQGILLNNKIDRNLLEAFLFYKMRYDYTVVDSSLNQLIFASGRPDASGIFQNSLLIGLSYNDLDKSDLHRVPTGIYAEASLEWGPEALFNNVYGRADFVRLNATAKGFLPLFDLTPKTEANLLSGYLAAFFSVDYCAGAYIPINIEQTFGGRSPRAGLGYAVRGYEDARFDGRFKAVLNLEFRLNLPQFQVMDTFTPGLVVFADSGYYNFLFYDESGFLFSTGAGVFLNSWGVTSFSIYTVFPLSRPRADGSVWLPIWFQFDLQF
jgi:hypothetical protein